MQRPIKFRAWDAKGKAMWHFNLSEATQFTQKELENWDVMQFTGFKDKNDKEIYEGDIVKEPYGKINIIYFEERFGEFTWDGKRYGTDEILQCPSQIQVIGNIYEKKEGK